MNYIFSKVGYSPRDRVILLKGRDVAIPDRSIFWQHEPVDNYLVLSSNYLDERHGHALLRRASEFKPRFYFGFPSAVLDYIKMARRIGVHGVSGIRAVFLTSENVFAEQRQEIRDFFQCDVLCQFGHTERSAFAYRLNDGAYKFISSYGLCRSVDNGIVATGFDNFVMPFINYELNDYVSEDREVHSQYDILLSSGEIEGRIQEFLVTGDARLISICSMGAGHFSALHDIEAIQYHQKAPGRATFRVQAPDAGLVDSQGIKEQLEEQSNFSIEFDIEFVDKIDKSTRGKRIMCVQELNIDEIRRSRAAALAAASAALAAPQPPTQQAHA